MKTIFLIVFALFNLNLGPLSRKKHLFQDKESIEHELNSKKQKKNKKLNRYNNKKFKRKTVYQKRFFALKRTQSKSVRHLNQRSLRMMYRNSR